MQPNNYSLQLVVTASSVGDCCLSRLVLTQVLRTYALPGLLEETPLNLLYSSKMASDES